MNQNVLITRLLNNRITVAMAWDKNMPKFFNSLERRFWDSKTKTWSFPSSAEDVILNELTKQGHTFSVVEYKPMVHIEQTDSELEIKSDYDPVTYEIIKSIPDAKWKSENKIWIISVQHLDSFVEKLTEVNIDHTLSRKEPNNDSIIQCPLTNATNFNKQRSTITKPVTAKLLKK